MLTSSLPRAVLAGYRQRLFIFFKKMSLPRACQAGSRQRRTLPRAIQTGSRQRLFCFFKKSLCREPARLALGKEGFAESRLGRLSAKTFYFFKKKIFTESTYMTRRPHIHISHIWHEGHTSTIRARRSSMTNIQVF